MQENDNRNSECKRNVYLPLNIMAMTSKEADKRKVSFSRIVQEALAAYLTPAKKLPNGFALGVSPSVTASSRKRRK